MSIVLKPLQLYFYLVLHPFAPGDFTAKTRFEASLLVFWSLSCYKELKLTTNRFTGRTLRGLLIQMQNISLRSPGMRRKQNFEISQTFDFGFLSSLLFSIFLAHFFSLAGHLVGFVLVRRVLRKAFRDLGLVERKGR